MRRMKATARYTSVLLGLVLCNCGDEAAESKGIMPRAACVPQSELNDSLQKLEQATKQLESLQGELKAFKELSRVLETHAVEGVPLARPGCVKAPCIVRSTLDACALVKRDPQDPPRFTGSAIIEGRNERPFFNAPGSAAFSDIELLGCQLSKTIVPFVSWRVEGAPDFRYIQQLATETEFDVCGAGCATFVNGELLLHAATSDDNLIPYSRYAWKGSADGRGRFVRVR